MITYYQHFFFCSAVLCCYKILLIVDTWMISPACVWQEIQDMNSTLSECCISSSLPHQVTWWDLVAAHSWDQQTFQLHRLPVGPYQERDRDIGGGLEGTASWAPVNDWSAVQAWLTLLLKWTCLFPYLFLLSVWWHSCSWHRCPQPEGPRDASVRLYTYRQLMFEVLFFIQSSLEYGS